MPCSNNAVVRVNTHAHCRWQRLSASWQHCLRSLAQLPNSSSDMDSFFMAHGCLGPNGGMSNAVCVEPQLTHVWDLGLRLLFHMGGLAMLMLYS
ncbi:hypothetical protein BPSP_1600 [Bifidobacterium pseudolongum subsp. pseudolongum]|nr:hypothetical protein BPSP_1600 [Bifidobacterium pseudolongum subsp. pseudolongum]